MNDPEWDDSGPGPWGNPGEKVAVARVDGGEDFIRRFQGWKQVQRWGKRRRALGGSYELYEWGGGGRRLVLMRRGVFHVRTEEQVEVHKAKLRRKHEREKEKRAMERRAREMERLPKRQTRW